MGVPNALKCSKWPLDPQNFLLQMQLLLLPISKSPTSFIFGLIRAEGPYPRTLKAGTPRSGVTHAQLAIVEDFNSG